jgi:stage II sporulation protein AA (anti-sigma F factor antagonist)
MSNLPLSEESGVLVLMFNDRERLNDCRSDAFLEEVIQAVEDRLAPRVAVDLGSIEYLSSSGLAVLVALQQQVSSQGGALALFSVDPIVLDLLQAARLASVFQIANDRTAAIAALRPV